MQVDIVLQGPVYPFTTEIVDHYLKIPYVNRIIVSCWNTDFFTISNSKVTIIKSDVTKLPTPGNGNVNYQLQTSKAGIAESKADLIFKIRTDQQIHEEDMARLVPFFLSNCSMKTARLDGKPTRGKILSTSMFTQFPYHPRDHMFLGYREDMETFFSIPMSTQPNYVPDWNLGIRAEAYLGANYYAQFSELAQKHLLNPHQYITDNAPEKAEAMLVSSNLRDSILLISPKLRYIWKKYGIYSYSPMHSSPWFEEYFAPSW
jgi:WavE lipopolysaccharide synthesis